VEQKAFIGIGSNIGDSIGNCITGIAKLKEDKRIRLISRSSMYATSPVSTIEQNDFINCAACVMWAGPPFELLALLNSIEEKMGRERNVKNGEQ